VTVETSHQIDPSTPASSEPFSATRPLGSSTGVPESLEGWRVRLRPLEQSDYDRLYKLSLHPSVASRWRFRGTTPSPTAFNSILWHGVDTQFGVEQKSDGRLIGLVTSYNTDIENRFTYLSMLLDPDCHRVGWPLEAGGLFLDYLFSVFSFHKVYAEVIDYNLPQFASTARHGPFQEEVCLEDHVYAEGRYWNVRVLAVYREDWSKRVDTRLARFFLRRRSGVR
jgi:RimJ/RimL family protein N-acetyltransferase